MPDQPLLTITVSKQGDEFRAELQAPSPTNGAADFRVLGIGPNAVEAIEVCLAELQSKAADGDEAALRIV